MIGALASSISSLATRLEEQTSGASPRVGAIPQRNATAPIDAGGAAQDTVEIESGSHVSTTAVNKIVSDGGLREASALLQVADAGFARVSEKLDEMKALAQIVTTTVTSYYERAVLTADFGELRDAIDKIALETEFNGNNPLAGNGMGGPFSKSVDLGDGETLEIGIPSALISDLAPELAADHLMTEEAALKAIEHIDAAQTKIAGIRANIAMQIELLSIAAGRSLNPIEEFGDQVLASIQDFGDQVDAGTERARAISQSVLIEADAPSLASANDGESLFDVARAADAYKGRADRTSLD